MWTYSQNSGAMLYPAGNLLAVGYSGAGAQKNDPAAESVKDRGPLPAGTYTIKKPAVDTAEHGPEVLWLIPDASNEMYGRGGFGIHGDKRTNPGCASEGCIVLPRFARDRIAESSDDRLAVVAELEDNSEDVSDAANGGK